MNYYYSIDGTEVTGPFSLDYIESCFVSGLIPFSTQVCAEGSQTWEPLASLISETPLSQQAPTPLRQPKLVGYSPAQNTSTGKPIYTMQGVQDLLEVYSDRVTITPKGMLGFLNKGIKGTKEIPFGSIVAVQFKEAGAVFSGFLQFTIPGGRESKGGLLAAAKDENTFMFAHTTNNAPANTIKQYIDRAIRNARTPQASSGATSLADELQKLVKLKEQGLLSASEFQAAKSRLIGQSAQNGKDIMQTDRCT